MFITCRCSKIKQCL